MLKQAITHLNPVPLLMLAAALWMPALHASSLPYAEPVHSDKTDVLLNKPEKAAEIIFDKTGDGKPALDDLIGKQDDEETRVDWNKPATHFKDKHQHKHPRQDQHHRHDKKHDREPPIAEPDDGIIHCPPGGTPTPSAVPIPAAVWLMASGIFGLGLTGIRRRRL